MTTQWVIIWRANNLWMKNRLKERAGTVWEEVKGSRRYSTNTREEFLRIWEEQNRKKQMFRAAESKEMSFPWFLQFVYVQGCKQTFKILVCPQLQELVCPRGWFLFYFCYIKVMLLQYDNQVSSSLYPLFTLFFFCSFAFHLYRFYCLTI